MKLKKPKPDKSIVQSTVRIRLDDYVTLTTELKKRHLSFAKWLAEQIKGQLKKWKATTKLNLENNSDGSSLSSE